MYFYSYVVNVFWINNNKYQLDDSIIEGQDRGSSSIFFRPSPLLFLSLSLFFKSRFCYRFGAGVRQRNRMSAHAGCDVRAAGKLASTVNLPDCLQRKYFLFMRLLLLLPFAPYTDLSSPFIHSLYSLFRPTTRVQLNILRHILNE